MVFSLDLDFRPRVLAEEDAVPGLDLEWAQLAVVTELALALAVMTLPSSGFSLAVSGMMIPPLVVSSSVILLTMSRSCNGLIFIGPKPPVG